MKTITKPDDFPVLPDYKFAVLEFGSITIPGDERSRTNPGHGYPESTETTTTLHTFDTQQELEAWISRTTSSYRKPFIVLHARRLVTETKTVVRVSI